MINEWLDGNEFRRIAEISESTLKRLKRKTKIKNPELLRLEDGKRKLHKSLLRNYSPKYFADFYDLVYHQLKIGKEISSINSLWGLFLLKEDWALMGTLNYAQEIPAQTCIGRFKRKITTLKESYPQIEVFYATEKNNDRGKGYHIHFFIKTPQNQMDEVKKRLEQISYSSKLKENILVEVYESKKLGAGYLTKDLSNNPDGYGLI